MNVWSLLTALTIFSISECEFKELSMVSKIIQKTCDRELSNFVVLDATPML